MFFNLGQFFQGKIFEVSAIAMLQISFYIIASLVLVYLIREIILRRLSKVIKKSANTVDDFILECIYSIGWPVYVIIGLNLGLQSITLPELYLKILQAFTTIIITIYVVIVLQKVINYFLTKFLNKNDVSVVSFFINLANITLWLLATLLILQNLGYDITALITGLGIGGIAIAFALQNILTDIFASISIYFDKPFKAGEFIQIGNDIGEVHKVGLKSTRIKTLQGEELVVSNKELTTARIHNFKRMQERRVSFNFGLDYQTTAKQLKTIPNTIQKIIEKSENTRFDRAHFTRFGDFSLIFEVVYYVTTDDYNIYMDVQQDINISLIQAFEKDSIKFAYPTETIYLGQKK